MGNALPDPGARGAAGETPTARTVSRCCVEKKEPGKADGRAADRQAPADHHSRRRQPGDRQSEAATVNAVSTIMLLMGLEAPSASRAVYPGQGDDPRVLDNARYHHARPVQRWPSPPGRRTTLHSHPGLLPVPRPDRARLWALMYRHTTHTQCYARVKDHKAVISDFLRDIVSRTCRALCDEVTDTPASSIRRSPDSWLNGV